MEAGSSSIGKCSRKSPARTPADGELYAGSAAVRESSPRSVCGPAGHACGKLPASVFAPAPASASAFGKSPSSAPASFDLSDASSCNQSALVSESRGRPSVESSFGPVVRKPTSSALSFASSPAVRESGDILAEIFSGKPAESGGIARFKCVVAYDGTDYCGWQSQPGGNSIQDILERRLAEIFKRSVRIHGSGRTDSGVHADAQVFHFDAAWRHPARALLAAFGAGLPDSIRVLKVSRVSREFHARYGAAGKRYVYRIYEGFAPPKIARYRWSVAPKLDVAAMSEAAEALVGTRDFTAFSASRGVGDEPNPVKTLRLLEVSRRGREIKITAEGSGFLYKMVRFLTGALVCVGRGRLKREDLIRALESKRRSNMFQAAPARGLSLEKVFYK